MRPATLPPTPTRTESHGWLLVLAMIPLFASTALYQVPLVLMAGGGAVLIARAPAALRQDGSVRLILALFLCLWLPQVLAIPWAVVPGESLRVAGRYLVYPLAAVFIAHALGSQERWVHLALGTGVVMSLWGLDLVAGEAGFGPGPAEDTAYPGGAFLQRHSMGHVGAVVSPLVFEVVRRRQAASRWLWLLPVLLFLLVLLSGRRVAWMLFLLSCGAYAGYLAAITRRLRWRWIVVLPALMVGSLALAYTLHPPTGDRILTTVDLLSSEPHEFDLATSWRVDIWTTAATAARAHWPTGVGARGFREVYEEHAAADDFWLQDDRTGALHPHQFALEVWVETGLAGLLGYLVVCGLVGWAVVHFRGPWTVPCGLTLALALFPLNAHLAFYGSYWSAMTWWAVGLTAAAIRLPSGGASSTRPGARSS